MRNIIGISWDVFHETEQEKQYGQHQSSKRYESSYECDNPGFHRTYLIAATPRIGFIFNFGNLLTYHLSLSIEQNLWFLLTGLHLTLEIGHHYSRDEFSSDDIESNFHGIPIHGMLGYRKRFLPELYVSLAAGVGMHIIVNRTVHPDKIVLSESSAHFSYQFSGEVGYRFGPGSAVFQLGFGVSEPSKISALSGNTSGLTTMLGYRMEFF